MSEIKFFFFIFSCFYIIKLLFDMGLRLTQENPKPISMDIYQQIIFGISISYIITYLRF